MTTRTIEPVDRLSAQLAFVIEIEKLKRVDRRTRLIGGDRHENSGEHSWHLAVMAMILAEYANTPVDLLHVIKMLLVHDIVEIDAGDTFAYDKAGNQDKAEREQIAAERIFGLLPADQAAELRSLWEEFDARSSPEARFANALDRLMPALQNLANHGGTWSEHAVTRPTADRRLRTIGDGALPLWAYLEPLLDDAEKRGLFAQPESETGKANAGAVPH